MDHTRFANLVNSWVVVCQLGQHLGSTITDENGRAQLSHRTSLCRPCIAAIAGFISSPEHEVLMVSYSDQSLSIVRRPSSVRCQLFALNNFSKTARRILK